MHGRAAEALTRYRADAATVADHFDRAVGYPGADKRAVEYARQAGHEASELGHDYVGSEHLVLAVVRSADPSLAALLQQHGIGHEAVKEAVVKLLHG